MKTKTDTGKSMLPNVFYAFGITALSTVGLIYFDVIFKPLVIALLAWYIIHDLNRRLGKITIRGKSMPRLLRGLSSFLIITLVVVTIFEVVSLNVEQISEQGPAYKEKMEGLMGSLSHRINDPRLMEYLKSAFSKLNLAAMATDVINALSTFMANFSIILIYVIFMLLEEAAVRVKQLKLFPEKDEKFKRFDKLISKIDKAVRAFLGSMILISFITAAISYVALLILGVDFPVLWAFLIFILNFIPYIGPFISSLLPAVLSVFQFGDLMHFVYVFGVLVAIQLVLGNFIQPKLMGKTLNISPITVLLALAFWGNIWGVLGMILAVPIASIAIIIMAQFAGTRSLAIMMSDNGEVGD
ncbi:MAG: AI-2E family transporter [Bacteroidales bacterium]|nr:AI-2E family transporter [Bacteroidales bacterium]